MGYEFGAIRARSAFLASALLLSTLFLPVVSAAEEEADGAIEEIIVTATYRETNLMDTPQAISAITESMVEDLGAQSMSDIYTMVPGLGMAGMADGNNRFTVRGVTSQTGGTGYYPTGATIGVYLDGTPVTAALGPNKQMSGTTFDIERIEVLKGPQGTLFGEGSQGGTIRYLYNEPDPTGFDAAVNVSYGGMKESEDNSSRIDAMVNVPIGDSAAFRLTLWDADTAGFIDALDPYEEDVNVATRKGFRAALRLEGERVNVQGTIFNSEQSTSGPSTTQAAFTSYAPFMPGFPEQSMDDIQILSLVIEADLEWGNFTSMTSVTDRDVVSVSAFPYASVWGLDAYYGGASEAAGHQGCAPELSYGLCPWFPGILNLGAPGSFIPDMMNLQALTNFGDSWSERVVQEFRLVSPGDQRIRWTVGAFWKDSDDHTQNQQKGSYFPGREAFGVRFDTLLAAPANTHTDSLEEFAVFGEFTYDLTTDLTGELEVTAGLRISQLDQYFDNTQSGTDDTPVSPKVVLSWRPRDELLVYVNYATGFRPGNVNHHMEFNARQYDIMIVDAAAAGNAERVTLMEEGKLLARSRRFFDGDEVTNYEVGLKTTVLDGRVRIVASAYVLDWADMIIVENDPQIAIDNPLSVYNFNSGGADISGFELEISAFITDSLIVRLAGDSVRTEVSAGPSDGGASPKGNDLVYSPENSASLSLDYNIPLTNGWNLDLHADHAWVAEQWANTENSNVVPKFEKTNARVTLRSGDGKWRVAVFGNNILNNQIVAARSGSTGYFWFQPGQIGLELGYKL